MAVFPALKHMLFLLSYFKSLQQYCFTISTWKHSKDSYILRPYFTSTHAMFYLESSNSPIQALAMFQNLAEIKF